MQTKLLMEKLLILNLMENHLILLLILLRLLKKHLNLKTIQVLLSWIKKLKRNKKLLRNSPRIVPLIKKLKRKSKSNKPLRYA